MPSTVRSIIPLVVCLSVVIVVGCSSGGGSSSTAPTSDPGQGVFAGSVSHDGQPVADAQVSISGIESSSRTDGNGNFVVSDSELAATNGNVEVAVLREGFAPLRLQTEVAAGQRLALNLAALELDPTLTISSPSGERIFSVPSACSNPRVLVEGFARLGLPESLQLDVVVILDRSGSTGKLAFDVDDDGNPDSVLEVERAATRCFLDTLDPRISRVAVVAFDDEADVIQDFTSDLDAVSTSLDTTGSPGGGTNYEAAFVAARLRFEALEVADAAAEVPAEDGDEPLPTPWRVVLFLSDGIPTSHGVPRNPGDSNLTQSAADRQGAVNGAVALGVSTGAELVAFSILPAEDTNRPRTTLPQCVAACGNGKYENVPNASQLEASLCGQPLISGLSLTVQNLTLGTDPEVLRITTDGFFSGLATVDITDGAPPAEGDPDHTVENTLQFTLDAFAGPLERTVMETLTIRLVSEADLALLNDFEVEEAQSIPETVSDLDGLTTPRGGGLGDDDLYDFLVSEFPDAKPLLGVESFLADDAFGGPTTTLNIDLVFKEACYQSDVGYIVFDPDAPPETAAEALLGVPGTQVFFNTGAAGASCGTGIVAPGTISGSLNVPTGDVIAFFIVPNRTLAQYQAQPSSGLAPLFTVPALNPGGFAQSLSYRTADGRRAAGGGAVVSPGPGLVLAFEDISIARRRSDQDFSDAVLFITGDVNARIDALSCD